MDDWNAWRASVEMLRRAIDDHVRAAERLLEEVTSPTRAAAASGRSIGDWRGRDPCPAASTATVESTRVQAVPPRAHAPASAASGPLRRALEHLAAHFDEPIGLTELARIAGCSRAHLARTCRRDTGATVHAHVVRLRLARAGREVQAGDKIEAVMLGVGYRGKRNFYRQFKARFGTTPGRYRSDGLSRPEPTEVPEYAANDT